jgi:hypothetical protein
VAAVRQQQHRLVAAQQQHHHTRSAIPGAGGWPRLWVDVVARERRDAAPVADARGQQRAPALALHAAWGRADVEVKVRRFQRRLSSRRPQRRRIAAVRQERAAAAPGARAHATAAATVHARLPATAAFNGACSGSHSLCVLSAGRHRRRA